MRVAQMVAHHQMPTVKEEFVMEERVPLLSEQKP